jgi:hypothetical protein
MQWTPDRNAGFSSCNPGRLNLPVIMDPIYGYQVTNVESQLGSTTSLLHWTRRMIEVRKQNPAFGLGDFVDLGGSNPSVFSFVRTFGDDIVLCVNNLSRFAQAVELDLRPLGGRAAGGAARRVAVPAHRRAALPPHHRRSRVLLVPPPAADRGGTRMSEHARPPIAGLRPTSLPRSSAPALVRRQRAPVAHQRRQHAAGDGRRGGAAKMAPQRVSPTDRPHRAYASSWSG